LNDWQKSRFSGRIVQTLFNTVAGKRIVILGFAFKKDTNDTRESPAIYVCRDLIREKATVAVFDPKVTPAKIKADLELRGLSPDVLQEHLVVCTDPYEAAAKAHGLAVLTEWDCFRELNWEQIFRRMYKPAFLFDGRNVLDRNELREIGFQVFAVGKG
jgi:UDPglucose 6-dehydrogenase